VKNREQTKRKLLVAVERLLSREGFRALGVNAVAREAGVDKVLIYRYFNGLPGLLKAFANESDYWPVFNTPLDEKALSAEPVELGTRMLLRIARELRERPATQEALRWELIERNELTELTHDELREVQGRRWIEAIGRHTDADIPALAAIVGGGLVYLALRAKTAERFNGMDLSSESDWQRLEAAARRLIEGYISPRTDTEKA
jgi:AcrR family transcriptional regulator